MAIINVTSGDIDDIGEAIQDATGGDVVKVAKHANNYSGVLNLTSGTQKASEVVIESADKSNPAVINGTIQVQGSPNNLTFAWLDFVGTEGVTINGIFYPTASEPLRFDGGRNLKVLSCIFKFWMNGLKFQKCTQGPAEVGNCEFLQIRVDPLMVYGVMNDFYDHHNYGGDMRIDPASRNDYDKHPDWRQIRPNAGQVSGGTTMDNYRAEFNFVDDPSGLMKGFFCNNEKNTVGIGFKNPKFINNRIKLGRYAGIELTGGQNALFERQWIHKYPGPSSDKHIDIELENSFASGEIKNCTIEGKIEYKNGALASKHTLTGTNSFGVNSDTPPPGWVTLTRGVNVGRVPDVTVPTPDTPATEWSNPPTNTASKDGRFVGIQTTATSGYDTGVLVIPDDSGGVAQAFAIAQSTVVGTAISDLEWSDGTNTGSFLVANPAMNGAGWRRFVMTADTLAKYAETSPNTRSNLVWRYRVNGKWSAWSTYTGSFTATSTPPVGKPTALTSGQWAFVGAVQEVSPGRFSRDFKITVAHTGAKWVIDGETLARPLAIVGTDGADNIYRLQPLDTGSENTVGYLGTRNFRALYSTDTVFSDPSGDAKSFTGPSAPPPPTPYDPGEILDNSGILTASGFVVQVPFPNQVSAPNGEISIDTTSFSGRAVIAYSGDLPPDSVGLLVLYGGKLFPVRDGRARVTLMPGITLGLICAYDAAGRLGFGRHFFTRDVAVNTVTMLLLLAQQ